MVSTGVVLAAGLALAVLLGLLLWAPRRPRPLEALAAVLLAYPLGRALAGAAAVADRVLTNPVLLPASVEDFELQMLHDMAFGLLLPLGAALLLWRGRAGRGAAKGAREVLAAARRALGPAGVGRRGPGARGALDALALLGAALALLGLGLAAERVVPGLGTRNESAYWSNLTPAIVLALSAAAAVSEEFVYRGLLLRALMRRAPWGWALALQALAFGFVHSGYGNWAHVLGPALFGALMGLVALRVGLLAAAVVHAGVDVAYLSLAAPHLQPAVLALPATLALLGLAALARTRGRAVKALVQGSPQRPSRA
jgi:membrane protease YdiL (CAAX protease family)